MTTDYAGTIAGTSQGRNEPSLVENVLTKTGRANAQEVSSGMLGPNDDTLPNAVPALAARLKGKKGLKVELLDGSTLVAWAHDRKAADPPEKEPSALAQALGWLQFQGDAAAEWLDKRERGEVGFLILAGICVAEAAVVLAMLVGTATVIKGVSLLLARELVARAWRRREKKAT